MTASVHFLPGPVSLLPLRLLLPHHIRHRTPPTPTTVTTPDVSSRSGGQTSIVIPRQLRKMVSLRSALGPLKHPSLLPRKRPTLLGRGWPNLTPWWRKHGASSPLYESEESNDESGAEAASDAVFEGSPALGGRGQRLPFKMNL